MPYDTNGQFVDYQRILNEFADPNALNGMHWPIIGINLAKERARAERENEYRESLRGYRFDDLSIECDQRADYRAALLDLYKGNFSAAIRVKKIMDEVAEQMIEDRMNG